MRQNAKGRQAKSKARLPRYEEMAAEAEKTRKLDFEEIQIPPGPRLGSVVVETSHLDKGFDARLLVKDLSFSLPRGGIVGVIGPNGVGKTTLFKTIVGLEQPDSGEVKVGETVKISYVDQSRGGIDPAKNVWQVVSDGLDHIKVGNVEMPSRAYVSAFGFKGPDQQKKAGILSGGERNRLNLALTLKEGGNTCCSTNRPTTSTSRRSVRWRTHCSNSPAVPWSSATTGGSWTGWPRTSWPGRAPTTTPRSWYWFEGNFASYEKNKVERMGQEAARPHAVTHRRLTRD